MSVAVQIWRSPKGPGQLASVIMKMCSSGDPSALTYQRRTSLLLLSRKRRIAGGMLVAALPSITVPSSDIASHRRFVRRQYISPHMEQTTAEEQLHEISNQLVDELVRIAPPTVPEIRFAIVSTPDGGADLELLDTHPDARQMQPNEVIFACCSQYLRLARDVLSGWTRSLFILQQEDGEWKASVEFKKDKAAPEEAGEKSKEKSE
jgi:hypothetical protein